MKPCGSGEVATLIGDFNQMVNTLAATTVSKDLLEASETRLREANAALREEIAERERMEEELLKARKLESLGVLAGGIADDFNNLFAVIFGHISLGKMLLPENDKMCARLTDAETACLKGKDLTYELLAFARGAEPVRSVVEPAPFIEDCVRSCLRESSLTAAFSLPGDLPQVKVDEAQMRQVLERIVKNADEAMGGGGAVEVGAEGLMLDEDNLLALREGKYITFTCATRGRASTPPICGASSTPISPASRWDRIRGRA